MVVLAEPTNTSVSRYPIATVFFWGPNGLEASHEPRGVTHGPQRLGPHVVCKYLLDIRILLGPMTAMTNSQPSVGHQVNLLAINYHSSHAKLQIAMSWHLFIQRQDVHQDVVRVVHRIKDRPPGRGLQPCAGQRWMMFQEIPRDETKLPKDFWKPQWLELSKP